jgi:excisionase family DNA binding protein
MKRGDAQMTDITIVEELLSRIKRLEHNQNRKPRRNLQQAASYLGMSVPTLRQLHKEGRGPKRTLIGRHYCYRQEDLDTFLEGEEH